MDPPYIFLTRLLLLHSNLFPPLRVHPLPSASHPLLIPSHTYRPFPAPILHADKGPPSSGPVDDGSMRPPPIISGSLAARRGSPAIASLGVNTGIGILGESAAWSNTFNRYLGTAI